MNFDDSQVMIAGEVAGVGELQHDVHRDPEPLVALTRQPKDVKEQEEDRNQRAHKAPKLDTQYQVVDELHVPLGEYSPVVCVAGIDGVSGAFNRAWTWRTVALPLPNRRVTIVWQLIRIWIDLVVVVPVGCRACPSLIRPGLLLGWPGSVLLRPGNQLLVRRYALLSLRIVRLNLLGLLGVSGKRRLQ